MLHDRVAGMARSVGKVQSSGGFAEQCVVDEAVRTPLAGKLIDDEIVLFSYFRVTELLVCHRFWVGLLNSVF